MTLNLLTFLALPMATTLLALLLLAIAYDIRTRRHKKSKEETVYRCLDCYRIFTDIHRTPRAQCPECGKPNATPR